ncbi:proline-rich protein 9-like [Rhinatrema bivittatum]|uniref:proline-rich protein 9-like n=1 Tax=Rhinatrema bivittatum TaxID=194408 RepID=UPI00112AB1C2|nr:proline-rich protein 9-like [Rhinatrema bivittatum]
MSAKGGYSQCQQQSQCSDPCQNIVIPGQCQDPCVPVQQWQCQDQTPQCPKQVSCQPCPSQCQDQVKAYPGGCKK